MALPDAEAETIVAANGKRLATFGKLNVPTLLEVVKASREAGYAIHDGSLLRGISGIGLLIRNSSGTPLGAISVSVITNSIAPPRVQEILLLLKREVRVIQNLLLKATEGQAPVPDFSPETVIYL
jgi:DNA-binding IclR family transcriptional regulator